MRKAILATAFATFLTGCVHTPQVEKVEGTWDGNGVLYALPRTAIDATFEVSKVDFKAPECKTSNDERKTIAEQLDLSLKQLSDDAKTVFAVHSGAITTRPIPDNDKVFVMRFPEHSNWANTSMLTTLNAQGVIESAEGSSTSKAVEIGTKVLEFGVSAGLGLLGAASSSQAEDSDGCDAHIANYLALKKSKINFRTGPTFPTGDALALFLAQIDVEMAEIQAKFIGKATIQKDVIQCSASPSELGELSLFEVDSNKGFNLKPGCTMLGKTIPEGISLSNYQTVKIKVEALDASQIGLADFPALHDLAPKIMDIGFVYNVPSDAFVSITGHPKAVVAKTKVTMPQFGELGYLPRVKGNSPSLNVSLHGETGALKSVTVTNDAAEIGTVLGSLSTATSSYFTTRQAIEDKEAAAVAAEAAKQDELALLGREQGLLEAKVAIYTAKDALEQWASSND
ncbi:MAG: DUF4831 family protein [Pseudomonadota bacterium]|jgi:Domain of unknown function (DUF4831)|nr:DUF4831 family protein [Pseudomonadota bacterium]